MDIMDTYQHFQALTISPAVVLNSTISHLSVARATLPGLVQSRPHSPLGWTQPPDLNWKPTDLIIIIIIIFNIITRLTDTATPATQNTPASELRIQVLPHWPILTCCRQSASDKMAHYPLIRNSI